MNLKMKTGAARAVAVADGARRRALRAIAGSVLALSAGLGAGVATPACAADAPPAVTRVAMLVQLRGPNLKVDERISQHLGERGYAVRLIDESATPDAARDADVIVISSTVSSKNVRPGWRTLDKPLVTWENDLLDDLAMTGKRHDVDFGETGKERYLWLVNAPHPIAAGLPAGAINVYGKQAPMSWGKPGLGAITIATVYGQPDKAAIFAYEKGATMDYEALAPARRVMFFLDNDTFTNLSPAGVALFDAVLDWAAGRR
ncbi:hypothetical protein P350_12545 [Burkholderia cepacia JBK9]|uniref:hypothetical protein n=1 Tax=Burkholderia arboris TaxID=488730 RepID=UPI000740A8D5|nr:hypothetical protein [Burkholderia arboris]ALX12306.1 hypothetical protein P350_12545 [Burkholderia cepacia JBK9]MCA8493138.1 hypothetical protein [Burkholderia arboris]